MALSKTITALVNDRRLASVECEKCKTQFHYWLMRTASGNADHCIGMDEELSVQDAEWKAHQALMRRLKQEADLVPCPQCNWVNEELIARYRKHVFALRSTIEWTIGSIAVGVIVFLIVYGLVHVIISANVRNTDPNLAKQIAAVLSSVFFLAPVYFFYSRRVELKDFGPNKNFPGPPHIPPLTPPALIAAKHPVTGALGLKPVYRPALDADRTEDWATFEWKDFEFPPYCCVCLEKPTTLYRPPIDLAAEYPYKVHPPICQRCLAEAKKQWWLGTLGGLAVAFLFSGCVALWFWNFDTAKRQMIFGFGGLFVSIITITIGCGWGVSVPFGTPLSASTPFSHPVPQFRLHPEGSRGIRTAPTRSLLSIRSVQGN